MRPSAAAAEAEARRIQRWARVAGVLYLIIILIGLFSEAQIRGALVVPGDPAATATRILAAQTTWRLGVAAEDLLLLCAVGLGYAWYLLLRPVDRSLIWLAMFLGLVSLSVESVGALQLHAVLTPLVDDAFVRIAGPQMAQLMAYQALTAHTHAFGLALIFFGAECLVIGHLVRRSGYFPAWVGVLMQLAGACYLINSFSMIIAPALQNVLFPMVLLPCLVGEGCFCLWLLFKGVDTAAWNKHAQIAGAVA
ncbi:MAG: DUF4386 domain-containing protein [Massilia sp.]